MSKWDDWIQSEEDSEMLIYEEWVRYVNGESGEDEGGDVSPQDQRS